MIDITIAMMFIATVCVAFVLGGILALFSYLLEYCFWENSIFSFWLPFLAKVNLKLFKPAKLKALANAVKNPEYDNMLIQEAHQMFFYKILGGCIICSNIWLGMITFIPIHVFCGLHWAYSPAYILFSSFLLRRILK